MREIYHLFSDHITVWGKLFVMNPYKPLVVGFENDDLKHGTREILESKNRTPKKQTFFDLMFSKCETP